MHAALKHGLLHRKVRGWHLQGYNAAAYLRHYELLLLLSNSGMNVLPSRFLWSLSDICLLAPKGVGLPQLTDASPLMS